MDLLLQIGNFHLLVRCLIIGEGGVVTAYISWHIGMCRKHGVSFSLKL